MSLFRRLLGGSSPAARGEADLHADPCWGDTVAREWRERLTTHGDWPALDDFLRGQTDVESRDFYVEVLSDTLTGRPAWIDEWVSHKPHEALPYLFRGRHGVAWAWDARGGGRASTVKEQGARYFFERLLAADVDLASAARLAPDDAGPWVVMLTVGRGLQKGIDYLQQTFEEVRQRYPWHQEAHRAMIQGVAAKWGGSDELMFAFAREASERAPEGLGVHTVLAEAHIEGWMSMGSDQYWQQAGVQEEILTAASRYLDSPRFVPTPRALRNRNVFAFCFWKLKDRERLRQQMEFIGDTVTPPWTLLRQPAAQFAAARRYAHGG